MQYSPLPGEGAAGLNVPLVVFHRGKLEALRDLSYRHAAFHILLVGEDQQSRLSQILEDIGGGTKKDNHFNVYM